MMATGAQGMYEFGVEMEMNGGGSRASHMTRGKGIRELSTPKSRGGGGGGGCRANLNEN